MQLEAKMLASNDVGRVNTELGKAGWSEILPSTPPSASDRSAAATTAWEAARQHVIDATDCRPKTDGAGYRLVIGRDALKRMAKGFVESEGISRQDATVSLSFRVRTRRQMSNDGDGASGYTLPVPGSALLDTQSAGKNWQETDCLRHPTRGAGRFWTPIARLLWAWARTGSSPWSW